MHTQPEEQTRTFCAVVGEKTLLTPNVVLLQLEPLQGHELPAFEPGAHIDLALPNGSLRQYSLLPVAEKANCWKVAVLKEPQGRGASTYVHDHLAVGDEVTVGGPRNHFKLEPAPAYTFIGGGIGITPLLAMVEECESRESAWELHYAGKSRKQMAFVEDLEAIYPHRVFAYPSDAGSRMDVTAVLARAVPGSLIYCCGPNSLVQAVQEAASAAQMAAGTVHVEHFAPVGGADDGPNSAVEVELVQTGTTVLVPPSRSILEVAEDTGAFVISSCLEGTCGSCETKVLAGIPEHRDSVLTEQERAANKTMMVCVSRAKSPRLVLDL